MARTTHDDLDAELSRLLAESVSDAQKREQTEFDRRIGSHANRLLLFGAGNIGRRNLSILRKSGQEPLAFLDNNSALWGTKIEGLEVLQPAEAARRFQPDDVAVLVTIWCGEATDKMADRIAPVRALGFKHIALFGHLAWKHPDLFLPHYALDLPSRALAQSARIKQAFELFQDRRSREIFVAHINWRLHLDYDTLPLPVNDTIYFNEKYVRSSPKEFLIDGGAFDGDTIKSYLETFGQKGFRKIVSFEPDPTNFVKLENYVASLPAEQRAKIVPLPNAIGDRPQLINVESTGLSSSRVGHGTIQIECRTIDEFADSEGAPTFIKLDIEGFEPMALLGASETMRKSRPVMTVCVYHVQNHVWEIPLGIAERVADYQYILVPHLSDGWDLVLYAVPNERAVI